MKIAFSRQISEEYSSIKFHDNPSSGCRVLCGQANRQTDKHEPNSHFSNLCERAWKCVSAKLT